LDFDLDLDLRADERPGFRFALAMTPSPRNSCREHNARANRRAQAFAVKPIR
jgi:hypothetical protein